MKTITLSQAHDAGFRKAVEAESGQSVKDCYQCGNCSAGCPAGFAYDLQAHQIMRCVQLGLEDRLLQSESLWMCLSCSTCSQRCPNNIDVAEVMETLRHMALRKGKVAVPRVKKFWSSFLEAVRLTGRSYEIGIMALYMMRSMRLTTDVDLAPTALRKGKLPFLPHMIGGANAVKRILERYEKRCRREGVES